MIHRMGAMLPVLLAKGGGSSTFLTPAALSCNARHFLVVRYPCPSWTTAGQRIFFHECQILLAALLHWRLLGGVHLDDGHKRSKVGTCLLQRATEATGT